MSTDPHAPDDSTVIWRYMDDWKFKNMLNRFSEQQLWKDEGGKNVQYFNNPGQLWFSYPWTFEDDDEGTLPDINENPEDYCDHMAAARGHSTEVSEERKKRFLATDSQILRDCNVMMAQLCGVSCWHRRTTGSTSMWDFISSKNGVAIKTTVGKLEHALAYAHNSPVRKAKPAASSVGYIDHSNYFLEHDGYRSVLAIITESWSYENETRFVANSPSILKLPLKITMNLQPFEQICSPTNEEKQQQLEQVLLIAQSEYRRLRSENIQGFHLPIKLDDLIQEVLICPSADVAYQAEVKSLLNNVGLVDIVVQNSNKGL